MNIYLVKRNDQVGFDEFDAFVVTAEDKSSAKEFARKQVSCGGWPTNAGISVKLVGHSSSKEKRLILASFNAG
jgi:hypothetical protein